MKKIAGFHSVLMFSALMLPAHAADALEIALPTETAAYRASDLPGYALVQRNCMTCHSAQYVATQPPATPRTYWAATVKKMKHPFGAQFEDEDMPLIVDYLARTYGAERTPAAIAVPAAPSKSAAPAAPRDAPALLKANNCFACHAIEQRVVGPAFKEVAARYAGKTAALEGVVRNIRAGGSGKWSSVPMPPYDQLSDADAQTLARYVLSR